MSTDPGPSLSKSTIQACDDMQKRKMPLEAYVGAVMVVDRETGVHGM